MILVKIHDPTTHRMGSRPTAGGSITENTERKALMGQYEGRGTRAEDFEQVLVPGQQPQHQQESCTARGWKAGGRAREMLSFGSEKQKL